MDYEVLKSKLRAAATDGDPQEFYKIALLAGLELPPEDLVKLAEWASREAVQHLRLAAMAKAGLEIPEELQADKLIREAGGEPPEEDPET